jgi:prevent-host-death family protein
MKTIGSFEAKTHLSSLLEEVSHGQSFLITKRGRPVASLSPVTAGRAPGPRDSIGEFRKQFAGSLGRFSQREIAEFKSQGRR